MGIGTIIIFCCVLYIISILVTKKNFINLSYHILIASILTKLVITENYYLTSVIILSSVMVGMSNGFGKVKLVSIRTKRERNILAILIPVTFISFYLFIINNGNYEERIKVIMYNPVISYQLSIILMFTSVLILIRLKKWN